MSFTYRRLISTTYNLLATLAILVFHIKTIASPKEGLRIINGIKSIFEKEMMTTKPTTDNIQILIKKFSSNLIINEGALGKLRIFSKLCNMRITEKILRSLNEENNFAIAY